MSLVAKATKAITKTAKPTKSSQPQDDKDESEMHANDIIEEENKKQEKEERQRQKKREKSLPIADLDF